MDKYYYLIAQLPTLFFAKAPEITVESFLDEANKWLGAKDFELLTTLDINNYSFEKKNPKALQAYQKFEFRLRTDLAQFREARKKDQDYKPASFPVSLVKEGNPLEVEIKLMEWRWKFIDELQREHHFDLEYLILYFLKLQLLRRYFQFDKEKGLKKFQLLYEETL